MALCTLSYGQKAHKLSSRILAGTDEYRYEYNDNGLVDSISSITDIDCGHKFTYDSNGKCLREDAYQIMDNGTKRHTSIVEYTYDENGRLKIRINKNSFGGAEFETNGKMEWSYDEKGNITTVNTYFPQFYGDGFDLFQQDRYTYDANGLLTEKSTYYTWGSTDVNDMEFSSKVEYTYNENGKITSITSKADDYRGGIMVTGIGRYTYDADGCLDSYEVYANETSSNPSEKFVFTYNKSIKNEDVMLPFNLEDEIWNTPIYIYSMKNSPYAIETEEWWHLSDRTGLLELVGNYEYTYSSPTGIGRGVTAETADAKFFINNGVLYASNLKQGVKVRIFSANGTEMASSANVSGGISLASLPKGIYVARADGSKAAFKFVR